MRSFVLLLLLSTLLTAEGLSFNSSRTHLTGKYSTLQLSGDQRREVERTRIVTLTDPQFATLRKIGPACPRQLQVLTDRNDSCTCGMTAVAVWFTPGKLEVPHSYIPTAEFSDGADPSLPLEGLVIDPDGALWLFGAALAPNRETEAMLSIAEKYRKRFDMPSADAGLCHIETPPAKAIRSKKAIEITLRRLKAKAKTLPIVLSAPGFIDYPDATK